MKNNILHSPVMLDIAGLTLSKRDIARLKNPLTGGLILFKRNWQDRAQLTALTAQIKKIRPDILIAVDHEGGRVQRFRTDGFTHLPAMRTLGQFWEGTLPKHKPSKSQKLVQKQASGDHVLAAIRAATACGYVLGAELRACGVDLSFTPVLDLDYGASTVIGDRAFSHDPRVVAVLSQALMHGLSQSGMGNCGKHFPGHGFVAADSHHDIPVDKRSLTQILQNDVKPYGWLGASLLGVMPAHVVYPKVDQRPAGFSSRWLQDILRGQLGFEGMIFSDDLSMAGARQLQGQTLSYTQAATAALQAGCDMVLLCNQSDGLGEAVDEILAGLAQAAQTGAWQPNPQSHWRRKRLLPTAQAINWQALQLDAAYQQHLACIKAMM